jgi:septal ring factor EnvC (AmiA/AmiB activator)
MPRCALILLAFLPVLPGCVAYEIRDELRTSNASFAELSLSREQLEESNRQLTAVNRQLAEVNRQLAESSARLTEVEKRMAGIDSNLGYIRSAVKTADKLVPFVKVPDPQDTAK